MTRDRGGIKCCLFYVGSAIVLLLLTAGALLAGTRSCTTSMVTLNICRSTNDVAYCLPISTVLLSQFERVVTGDCIHAPRRGVYVREVHPSATVSSGVGCGNVGEGRDDNRVIRSDSQSEESEVERRRARAASDGVFGTTYIREPLLELANVTTLRNPPSGKAVVYIVALTSGEVRGGAEDISAGGVASRLSHGSSTHSYTGPTSSDSRSTPIASRSVRGWKRAGRVYR